MTNTEAAPDAAEGRIINMSLSQEKIADLRVKHLEMVQAVVTRIANYGATLKNYCITLTVAVCGFSITLKQPLVALLTLLPIIIFALLDAQFLRVERKFRALFDSLRTEDWTKMPSFDMSLRDGPSIGYWAILRSWSIAIFYLPLGIGVIVIVIAAGCINGRLF